MTKGSFRRMPETTLDRGQRGKSAGGEPDERSAYPREGPEWEKSGPVPEWSGLGTDGNRGWDSTVSATEWSQVHVSGTCGAHVPGADRL